MYKVFTFFVHGFELSGKFKYCELPQQNAVSLIASPWLAYSLVNMHSSSLISCFITLSHVQVHTIIP